MCVKKKKKKKKVREIKNLEGGFTRSWENWYFYCGIYLVEANVLQYFGNIKYNSAAL